MTRSILLRTTLGLFASTWMSFATLSEAGAVEVFGGQVTATAVGCAPGDDCPPDLAVVDTHSVTQFPPTPFLVDINTSATAPSADASVSLQIDGAGIAAIGVGEALNPGNAHDTNLTDSNETGFNGLSGFFGATAKQYVAAGPAPGMMVSLTGSLHFSALLQGDGFIGTGKGGATAFVTLGPIVGYGTSLSEQAKVFDVFSYALNTSAGALGPNSVTTPDTLMLTIEDVNGSPVATTIVDTNVTVGGSGAISELYNSFLTVDFEITVGEPFWFGLAMSGQTDGGNLNCDSNGTVPPCGGRGDFNATLEISSITAPGGVTVSEFNLAGDMNIDGNVTVADVDDFILGLTDADAYTSIYGVSPALHGDVDGNGVFDTGDTGPFSALLGGPATALLGEPAVAPAVPEPSAIVVILCGLPFWLLAGSRRGCRR